VPKTKTEGTCTLILRKEKRNKGVLLLAITNIHSNSQYIMVRTFMEPLVY